MNESAKANDLGSIFRLDRLCEVEQRIVRRQMALLGDPPVTMVIGNGSEVRPVKGKSVGTVRIRDRKTLLHLFVHPELHFGDAYSEGSIEVEGDLTAVMDSVFRCMAKTSKTGFGNAWRATMFNRPRLNTLSGSKENIHDHYDIGNDFYRLWLDKMMQ